MKLRRPYRDATPTRVHVLMAIIGVGLALLIALGVTSVTRDRLTEAHLVERASTVAKKAAKAEVNAQVDNKVEAEVTDQLDARLLPDTDTTLPATLPPSEQPIDRVDPNTTTTEPEPFDLTTTTTTEPFDLTTTTTIEVPTTVTIPDPPPLP